MVVIFAFVSKSSSSIISSSKNGGQSAVGAAGIAAARMDDSVQQREQAGITLKHRLIQFVCSGHASRLHCGASAWCASAGLVVCRRTIPKLLASHSISQWATMLG